MQTCISCKCPAVSEGGWGVGGGRGGETRYKENHFYSLPLGQAEASIY